MLDPRIYRMSLLLPVLALVVLAFSLRAEPGARSSTLAPIAYDGSNVTRAIDRLQSAYPRRTPGSSADRGLAGDLAGSLGTAGSGFSVTREVYGGDAGALENVVATRPGTASGAGAIVVVASRGPGRAGLAASATLLELGRVLGGETLDRTVVLASVDGVRGARRLAASLTQPSDAVIVLGDLGAATVRGPVIVPWSGRAALAPLQLRNTLSATFENQTGVRAGAPHILGQLAHLAFPLTVSAQAPFADRGVPAVELSLSGERGARAGEATAGTGFLGEVGRSVLSAVSALDGGGAIPAPSAYVVFDHQIVPSWAMSLFVLMLILPVALTTFDGLARARRRRYPVGRALRAVLAAASPCLAAVLVIALGGAVGALPSLSDAPAPGTVHVSGGAIAVLAVAALAALACGAVARSALAGRLPGAAGEDETPAAAPVRAGGRRDPRSGRGDGAWAGTAAATLLLICLVAVLVWIANPFAAALLVPALHLWLWALDSDLPLPAPARVVLLLLGAVPTAGLVLYYAHTLGFSAPGLAWEAVLLLAGHGASWVTAIEWSVAIGCLASAVGLVVRRAGARQPAAPPVSVRGPIGYAGPGSLGGTKSALRR